MYQLWYHGANIKQPVLNTDPTRLKSKSYIFLPSNTVYTVISDEENIQPAENILIL